MTAPAAALYVGRVTHARLRPVAHRFGYDVASLWLDLDRLAEAGRMARLFSISRLNLYGFSERDHGPRDGGGLAAWAREHLAAHGLSDAGARIELLCLPRVLGWTFNPLSVIVCRRADGRVGAVIHEVRNTFGGKLCYLVPVAADDGGTLRHAADKALHVSPFMDMAQRYHFALDPPGETYRLVIRQEDADGVIFVATHAARRAPLDDRLLLGLAARLPLVSLKVFAAIHWQALRLWAKGVRFRPAPPPPAVDLVLAPQGRTPADPAQAPR